MNDDNGPSLVLVVVLLLVLGGGAWFWFKRSAAASPPVAVTPAPVAPAAPAAPPAPVQATPSDRPAAPAPAAAPATAVVTFPDGSTAPALNGVTEPVKLLWNDRPYSPIKTKIVDRGTEWYVHEDGTHSTVLMTTLNGKPAAFGLCCSPTEALPTVDQILKGLPGQGPGQGR